jgi:hypothetical protein
MKYNINKKSKDYAKRYVRKTMAWKQLKFEIRKKYWVFRTHCGLFN